jgi:hypothetical protein
MAPNSFFLVHFRVRETSVQLQGLWSLGDAPPQIGLGVVSWVDIPRTLAALLLWTNSCL